MTCGTQRAITSAALGATLAWVVPIGLALVAGYLREKITGRASW